MTELEKELADALERMVVMINEGKLMPQLNYRNETGLSFDVKTGLSFDVMGDFVKALTYANIAIAKAHGTYPNPYKKEEPKDG